MFSFLSPWFLVGALAAAVPVVLHLFRRLPERRVRFTAVWLLKRAPVEHTSRHRLRDLLLLVLRVAVLVLLALAFARPFFPDGRALASRRVGVIVLDTSLSMSAPGRFERARQLAREAIGRVPAGDDVAVVTFSDAASLASPPSSDRGPALSAVAAAAPDFGATRFRAGLNTAAQACAGRCATIVVVTDLQENGWDAGDEAAVPESAEVQISDVGEFPENLAVTAVRAEAGRVLATVRGAGPRARQARVRLTIDGRPRGESTIEVPPNQSVEVAFERAGAGEAAVSVDDRDGVKADNVRYAVLGDAGSAGVLMVTAAGDLDREAFFLHQALLAGARTRGPGVAGVSAAGLSAVSSERLSVQSVVIVLSTRGLERRGREVLAAYVRAGGGILIAAGPEIDSEVIADVLGAGSSLQIEAPVDQNAGDRASRGLAPADVRHPIFESFGTSAASLALARFRTVSRVSGPSCQTLATFTTGEPALIDCTAGSGRALVFASDMDNRWNDFPLRATFVPFVHEAIRYLASGKRRASEYVVGAAPAGVPPAPGIHDLRDAGSETGLAARVAVNVDSRESEIARMSAADFQSAITRLKDTAAFEGKLEVADQESRQHLWQYVMMLAIAVLALEGVVASRTA